MRLLLFAVGNGASRKPIGAIDDAAGLLGAVVLSMLPIPVGCRLTRRAQVQELMGVGGK